MAQKRKAKDAFGAPEGVLSAFAAARLKRADQEAAGVSPALAEEVATTPYDGHHSSPGASTRVSRGGSPNDAVEENVRLPPPISYRTNHLNVVDDDAESMTLLLGINEIACIAGEYDVTILDGAATIYGFLLRPESGVQRVYAPSTHALPVITARRGPTKVCLRSVKSSLRTLERLSPVFRNIWTADEKERSFKLLQTSSENSSQRPLSILDTDDASQGILTQIAGRVNERDGDLRVITLGPKSSGKSTFNRQICNAIAARTPKKRCLYLDLDPGQPEFGPPGQVSLVEVRAPILGHAFTHPASKKSKSYRLLVTNTLASTSFKDDPEHYIACVRDIMVGYRARVQGKDAQPLIVNASGWVTGLGATVMIDLLDVLGITDTVLIDGDYPLLAGPAREKSEVFYKLPRPPARPSSRTPAELRTMQMMSYFHSQASSVPRWTAKPISSLKPWLVSYSATNPGIHAIVSYGQAVPPEHLSEILDGSIVAIISIDISTDTTAQELLPMVLRTPNGLPYIPAPPSGYLVPLDPGQTTTHSLALVRAIDPEMQTLHLITPLSESEIAGLMERRVMLVRGNFDSPDWAYLEDLYSDETKDAGKKEVAEGKRPWVRLREEVGVEGGVWRVRHPPMAGQISG
ncbi:hypothetical protein B0A48_15158 [Cryoendolithus antarcticus]|uniref:Polynucleotide 5'-hydroxyl-kinase GRC3 n=1 Tax=Cryoendolithus antarcticus TaxID=1507870 RepID=A0A1V8SI48_9PEZI|nr:hypothetical protein B0A48_15158 [Cryoendolithus antarcticus]